MAFVTWPTPFVDDVSTIPAAALNTWRVDIGRAVDGANGGTYPADIVWQGAHDIGSITTHARIQYTGIGSTRHVFLEALPVTGTSTYLGNFSWQMDPSAIMNLPLRLPHGATLVSVSIPLNPAAHGGSWPPTAPSIRLMRMAITTASQVGSTVSDSLVTQATYEGIHYLVISPSAVIDNATYVYWLELTWESGVNGLAGVVHTAAVITVTVPEQCEFY